MIKRNNTITALATPDGIGALAVIRISGSESFNVFRSCIIEKEKFDKIKEKNIGLFTFFYNGSIIDEITAIKYVNPKSFTGEDMVEIICHGGKITVNEIIRALIKSGSQIAQRGEFTRRAFDNGKIDLLKAESIRAIIESKSIVENKNALNAYLGSGIKHVEYLKNCIIEIICDIESEIEFAEEDEIRNKNDDTQKLVILINNLHNEINKRKKIKEIGYGIKVLIAGPPNAGKSTLYNKILGYNRSIINEEAGTTRDLITERIEVNKKTVTIIDSAGIRITDNIIEQEGIKKSEDAIDDSSILIWITSANESITDIEIDKIEEIKSKNTIFVINKSDTGILLKETFFNKIGIDYIKISLKNDSIDLIEDLMIDKIEQIQKKVEINDFITNERQEHIVANVLEKLIKAQEFWYQKEICAIYLNEALNEVENFTGKIGTDEILNSIFDKFCIGK